MLQKPLAHRLPFGKLGKGPHVLHDEHTRLDALYNIHKSEHKPTSGITGVHLPSNGEPLTWRSAKDEVDTVEAAYRWEEVMDVADMHCARI